ncbi:1-deoxy-D-xylulose-5-phosphate synthase [candidate division BRC1 bacterium HGW-BRC1-1]|jgi:1-deoxy-D-xylulose-5-phosphate synthase|nr:MAG: 1-deoxy-D-xylulose-5-phosphate synthase [candidate division BRC1 bacterium HGW-BRC1-1]
MKYLQNVTSPQDIRNLSIAELKDVAADIREVILETVSVNGGHLASSLGAVELAVGLHKVFETPKDKILWDVGHQGYPHKLLTGRLSRFNTLRGRGGLSGFLRRDESEFDVFGAGHAGTSISAAVGIAQARDIKKEDFDVVAVIGDGSMTCGLPFEGLNNAGHTETDLLVVLNDNEMSISENVGALSRYFNWLVQSQFYNKGKEQAYALMKRAPMSERVLKMIHKLEESTKGLIVPSLFFEDLGFRYIGPVDGHNLDELVPTLQSIHDHMPGPVLLHALTTKGKGYKQAEGDAIFWHSPPNFKVDTGEYKDSTAQSYTHVYGDTLVELAEKDPRIVVITAAMATGTGLVPFSLKIPERYKDVGIAESHAVVSAAGMAIEGLRPFVTIYSTFLQRAFDNIMHDVALQNLPVIFAMDRAGLVGFDGPTHHGLLDIGYMRMIPNMVVMAPKDESELRDMMVTAVNHTEGPIAFRYPRGGVTGADITREPVALPIGKSEMIRPAEGQVCILSYGHVFANVMKAVKTLSDEGIEVAVVNARFVKPIDLEMLREVTARYPVLLSVEDGAIMGGFGSAVNESLVSLGIRTQCEILGVPDIYIEHGDQSWQAEVAGISPDKIVERVKSALARSASPVRSSADDTQPKLIKTDAVARPA